MAGISRSRCAVCRHPERSRLEILRAGGASYESLAVKFSVSRDQVWRHWHRHVPEDVKAEYLAGPTALADLAGRAAEEGLSTLDYLAVLRTRLMAMFSVAAEAGDRAGASTLAARLLSTLKTIGLISGELAKVGGDRVTNNTTLIINSPIFADLQTRLLKALRPFPDARSAVIAALREIDEEHERAPAPVAAIIDAHAAGHGQEAVHAG